MSVYNDQKDIFWPDLKNPAAVHYRLILEGDSTVQELSQTEAFELIQWVIQNAPQSKILPALYQVHYTSKQHRIIRQLEERVKTGSNGGNFLYRGSPSLPPKVGMRKHMFDKSVRRRLFIDDEPPSVNREEEPQNRLSSCKIVMIIGGSCVIFFTVVKPILKKIREYYNANSG